MCKAKCEGAAGVTFHVREMRDFGCADERVNERGWVFSRVGGMHRDSDLLAQSNHYVVLRELAKLDPDEEGHGVLSASHWAVGWVDHVVVDPARADLVKVLQECADALAGYPVLDEMDWSQRESDAHDEGTCDEHCSLCEMEKEDHRHHVEHYAEGCPLCDKEIAELEDADD